MKLKKIKLIENRPTHAFFSIFFPWVHVFEDKSMCVCDSVRGRGRTCACVFRWIDGRGSEVYARNIMSV